MNIDYKVWLGGLAVAVGFIGYYPYIRDVIRGTTKPHAFSWLAWGLIEVVAFFAQLARGGGSGIWVTGFSAILTLFVAFKAFELKDKDIKLVDWIALSGALIGVVLWKLTDNPLTAVVCITLADALAFIPTFRKGFYKPNEETLFEYLMSAVKWAFGIAALGSLNLTTALFPVSVLITNLNFVVMAVIRRKQIQS